MQTVPRTIDAASLEAHIERVSWGAFLRNFAWKQSEHVTMLGPNGCGKSTLALRLLPLRRFVVAFGTKPKDTTLDYLIHDQRFRIVREWPPSPTEERVILWPPIGKMTDVPDQRKAFQDALSDIYEAGSWCVYFDEAWYLDVFLGLRKPINLLLQQARAMNVSIVATSQRPVYISKSFYSEATHLFLWRMVDLPDRKRLLEMSGSVDKRHVIRTVGTLARHEVLYVNTRDGSMLVTQVEL